MDNEKRCARCGTLIAVFEDTEWHRFIRLKYCPECRMQVKREQTAASKRDARKINRTARRQAREALARARAENEQLRELLRENARLRDLYRGGGSQ